MEEHKYSLKNRILSDKLIKAVKTGDVGEFKMLLTEGASIETMEYGFTLLHIAAEGVHAQIVKLLLDAGAKIDAINFHKGLTPMHKAAMEGHAQVVKLLLDAGADRNIDDNYEYTPLDYARENGHNDVVELLESQTN